MKILDGNAFKLRITCEQNIESYRATTDMHQVDSLLVNFVRRGRSPQEASVDDPGRVVVENGGDLAIGVYGVELTGYYKGAPWRFYAADVFDITDDENEVSEAVIDEGVPIYDVTFTLSLGGSADISFVDSAIINHDNDNSAHPELRQELSAKVDDILVDDESVVETDPVTGKKEVHFDSDNFGKVDDVKVNGLSVVSQKVAAITVPQKISDLTDDSDFVKDDEMAAALADKQDTITAVVNPTVTEDGGSPGASVTFEDGELGFAFKNLRMKFSDLTAQEKESIRGAQGASAVFDPNSGNVLATLENTIGRSDANAMTQKSVTDELTYETKTIDLSSYTKVNIYISNADPASWTKGSANANCIFVPVEPGTILKAKAQSGHQFIYAFLTGNTYTQGQTVNTFADNATARTNITANKEVMMVVPSDAAYLYIMATSSGSDMLPDYLKIVTTVKDRLTETKETADRLVDETAELKQMPTTGYDTVSYFIDGNTAKWDASNNNKYSFIPVEPNHIYVVSPMSGYTISYAFLQDTDGIADNANVHYANGYTNRVTSASGARNIKLIAPSDAHYFAFMSLYQQSSRNPDMFAEQITLKKYVEDMPSVLNPSRKIHVRMQRQAINISTGGYGTGDNIPYFSCARIYKKPADGIVTFTLPSVAASFGVVGYDKDQTFIERILIAQISGVSVHFSIPATWEYFKFYITAADGTSPDIADVMMDGCFPHDCEHFNVPHKTADANGNYFIPITLKVDAATPTNQDVETATVTDASNIKVGYGLLALPSSYSPDGTPTRLIIFCHGSAVHIGCNASSFPSDSNGKYGVNPTYWLSEGYAVLDIDGMPKGSTSPYYYPEMQHWCVPLAYQFYLAGYEYAIENYNLCRDGVFLGGRSLGGGMALLIMANKEIPVKACCPFAPQHPAIFRSLYSREKAEKEMIANACGIYNPEEVAWPVKGNDADPNETGLTPIMPVIMMDSIREGESDERYIGNFGRLMQISPSYRLCVNNPSPETLSALVIQKGNRTTISSVYNSLVIKTDIPTKFFGAYDDTTINPYWINLWVRMFRNGGCIVEHRMFPSGGHGFDLDANNLVSSFVTHKGVTLTNVSLAYIEALQFWRRYE